MQILDNLISPGIAELQSALGRATHRQSMLMNNLANVNVPGYKRKDIDFHTMLESAKHSTQVKQMAIDDAAQRRSDQTSIRLDGNNVDLEREVASVTETEMFYQAVTDLTAGYFQGLKSVIREGK